jgi:hypothetical protein
MKFLVILASVFITLSFSVNSFAQQTSGPIEIKPIPRPIPIPTPTPIPAPIPEPQKTPVPTSVQFAMQKLLGDFMDAVANNWASKIKGSCKEDSHAYQDGDNEHAIFVYKCENSNNTPSSIEISVYKSNGNAHRAAITGIKMNNTWVDEI